MTQQTETYIEKEETLQLVENIIITIQLTLLIDRNQYPSVCLSWEHAAGEIKLPENSRTRDEYDQNFIW